MKPVKPHAHDSDMAAVSAYARILGPRSDRNQRSRIDSTYSSLNSSPIKETRGGGSSNLEKNGEDGSESENEIDAAENLLEPGSESDTQGKKSRRMGKKRVRKFAPIIHKSLPTPNNFSLQSRQTYLNALFDYIIANAREIENSLARDGLCKWDVVGELNCVVGEIEKLRNSFGNWLGEKNEATGRRYFRFPSFFSSISLFNRYATTTTTARHPIGSILLLPSHIHPLQSLFTPLAAAIAGGNRSVIKLNSLVPSFSEFVRSSWKGWIDIDVAEIVGGEVTAEMSIMREHDRVLKEVKEVSEIIKDGIDMVWARVDGMSKPLATELSKLSSVNPNMQFLIETGDICPVIIDSSVPLSFASNRIIHGKFTWAGQSPTSPSFLIVISPTSSAPSPSPNDSSKGTSLPLYLKQNSTKKVQPDLTNKIILHLRKTLVRHYSLDPSSSLDYTRVIARSDYHLLKELMSEEPGESNFTARKKTMSATGRGVWVEHQESDEQENGDLKVESEIESEFENESENGMYPGGDSGFLVERATEDQNPKGNTRTESKKGNKPEIDDSDTFERVEEEGKAKVSADFNDETRYIAPKIVDLKVEGMGELIQHDIRGPILPVVEVASLEDAITFLQNRNRKYSVVYVFSKDKTVMGKMKESVWADVYYVNDVIPKYQAPPFPLPLSIAPPYFSAQAYFTTFTTSTPTITIPCSRSMEKIRKPHIYPPYDNLKLQHWKSKIWKTDFMDHRGSSRVWWYIKKMVSFGVKSSLLVGLAWVVGRRREWRVVGKLIKDYKVGRV